MDVNEKPEPQEQPRSPPPIFFFRVSEHPYGVFSQFHRCKFTDPNHKDIVFVSAEQYMMYNKALVFDNQDIAREIMTKEDSQEIKSLGRKVKGFEEEKWNKHKKQVVERGNLLKFGQNEKLKKLLLQTGDALLMEASSDDAIWGIGMKAAEAKRALEQSGLSAGEAFALLEGPESEGPWKGENLLGKALMSVREQLR